jgi:hypothetical protein
MIFVYPRRQILLVLAVIAAVWIAATHVRIGPGTQQAFPDRISDTEFWRLVTDFSETGGYFRSENFVSNETAYQHVIPALKRQIKPGGIYLGVGPDQNFTYIASLAPKLAFIVDIRRQNMLLHLMYKALFELSNNRAEFLSKLFGRPMPEGLSKGADTEQLFAVFGKTAADPGFARETLDAIVQQLDERHHFELSSDDLAVIEHVHNAFVSGGPDIRYSFPNQYSWRPFPSYSQLMLENDGTTENGGENFGYVASEENFQRVKRMESENRIIPIVGDFAGDKALRSVGGYVREHGSAISTFYTSNVEFYLFQTDDWKKFFNTVSHMPVTKESVFVRSYFNNYGSQFQDPPSWFYSSPQPQSYSLIDNIPSLLAAFGSGRVHNYLDVIRRSTP